MNRIYKPNSRHGPTNSKYKKCLSIMMLYALSNTETTFESQFMKNLNNTEAELKEVLLIKKACNSSRHFQIQSGKLSLIFDICFFLREVL